MHHLYVFIAVSAHAFSGVPRRHQAPLRQHVCVRAATADAAAEPTLKELANFAGPAIVLWISGPLLTLIDTSAVGLCSGAEGSALEIAALGPGGSVCDGAVYFYTFLNIAMTNFLASEATEEKRDAVVARGATLALRNGILALIWLRLIARPFLAFFIGGRASGALEVQRRAATYVNVRALGVPFLLLGNALTAALLGAKDSKAPLIALGASAGTNIVGDFIAVGVLGRGVRGAAEATALSQVVQCVLLARLAARKLGKAGESRPLAYVRRLLKTQRRLEGRSFKAFAGPVLVLVFSKLLSFGVMTFTAARFGSVPLAAHQLTLTIFLLASLVLDAVAGQTAQAFLPPLQGQDGAQRLGRKLLKLSTCAAFASAATAGALASKGARLFSGDPAVAADLATVAVPLAASVLLHGPIAHGEGVCLATSDLKFVGASYAISGVIFPALVGLCAPTSLRGVWNAWVGFQAARAVVLQLRARHVVRMTRTVNGTGHIHKTRTF